MIKENSVTRKALNWGFHFPYICLQHRFAICRKLRDVCKNHKSDRLRLFCLIKAIPDSSLNGSWNDCLLWKSCHDSLLSLLIMSCLSTGWGFMIFVYTNYAIDVTRHANWSGKNRLERMRVLLCIKNITADEHCM